MKKNDNFNFFYRYDNFGRLPSWVGIVPDNWLELRNLFGWWLISLFFFGSKISWKWWEKNEEMNNCFVFVFHTIVLNFANFQFGLG